jgi:hypothetical protein
MYPMSNPPPFEDLIRPVFSPTQRGVAGLVDDLLRICRDRGLQLDWHAGQCRIRSIGVVPEEAIEVPLPRSVFRAILARLAALCDERGPGSVSPYGGEGELAVGVAPVILCAVTFTNTPGEQRVQLTRVEEKENQGPPHNPGVEAWEDVPGGNDHRGSIAIRPTR